MTGKAEHDLYVNDDTLYKAVSVISEQADQLVKFAKKHNCKAYLYFTGAIVSNKEHYTITNNNENNVPMGWYCIASSMPGRNRKKIRNIAIQGIHAFMKNSMTSIRHCMDHKEGNQ